MKRFVLSVLLAFSLFVCIYSCGVPKHIQSNPDIDVVAGYMRMEYTLDKVLGISQVDSMITVDRLQPMDKWIISGFGARRQYIFIRSLGENELIYTATTTQVDTLFKCTKRVVKPISE